VQAFHFRFTMNRNIDAVMWEAFDVNPVIRMWLKVLFLSPSSLEIKQVHESR
jgi:hypothetical protein